MSITAGLARAQQAFADLPDAPQQAGGNSTPSRGSEEVEQAFDRQKRAESLAAGQGSVSGTVMDQTGAAIPEVLLLLRGVPEGARAVLADTQGRFVISGLPPGEFTVQVSAEGFLGRSLPVTVKDGAVELPTITLFLPQRNDAVVQVTASQHDVAEAQVKLEEKQRVFGVFPNYYISYMPNAARLSSKQKFGLAVHSLVDPVSFALDGASAGFEQASDSLQGYGEGALGYGKRFGAAVADSSVSTIVGGALLPTLLRQDPRYFWKGTGSRRSRVTYAISRVIICKGDNGKWQPNYSNVLGNFASAGISNLYYPDSDRDGAGLTIRNVLVGTATGALANLYQEFFSRHMTPAAAALPQPHADGK